MSENEKVRKERLVHEGYMSDGQKNRVRVAVLKSIGWWLGASEAAIGSSMLFVCPSVCGAVHSDSQGWCTRLKVAPACS